MTKKVLVTGATGFVGSNLCRRLLQERCDVHVIVRVSSDLSVIHDILDSLIVHKYDGTIESMMDIMAKSSPGAVLHLASLYISEHRSEEVAPLVESNILYGTHLVEAMVHNKVNCLINTGTAWQHYDGDEYNPANLYAATKQAFESILKYYVEARMLKVVTLKLFDTYGPNDTRLKLLYLLKKFAESGETLAMSPGEQILNLVHINDVVDAFCIALERIEDINGGMMESYSVGADKLISLKDLVVLFEKITGSKLNIAWGKRSYREREVMQPWDGTMRLPGWKPSVSLESGIKEQVC